MNNQIESQKWEFDDDERLLTPADVAEMLRVPISWVYAQTRGRSKAGLPFVKMGRYVRFDRVAVREFVASNAKSRR
jgi:excisionase family DNA binding protein